MGTNDKRRNNKSILSQNIGQTTIEVTHNPQIHNYSNWSWQHKILFIQVQNNRQPNVPLLKRSLFRTTLVNFVFYCW